MTQMRTQFFQDMVDDDGKWNVAYLRKEDSRLFLEQQAGRDQAHKTMREMYPDDQNPYLNPAVYRAMLREQYMTIARMRAGGVNLSDGKLT